MSCWNKIDKNNLPDGEVLCYNSINKNIYFGFIFIQYGFKPFVEVGEGSAQVNHYFDPEELKEWVGE